jgi:lipoate-protein ligase A
MSPVRCRLLPYVVEDGPHNMAADEVLLEAAARGTASLRFYGWKEATLSLGYFQPERSRRTDARLAELPFVRRPTGGATLVHHHEVTYALGLPANSGRSRTLARHRPSPGSWLHKMHAIITVALNDLGVIAHPHTPCADSHFAGVLCFQQVSAGDVVIGQAKVVGSSQRRQRGALLQHGAILLSQSPYTPALPGIRELTGRSLATPEICSAVCRAFARETGWQLLSEGLTSAEHQRLEELAATKYAQDAWTLKR